jgi:V/A-type H+-transporting ATPase subunit I
MYRNIRDGKIADALMDQGLWILLILSLIAFALIGASAVPANLIPAGAEQAITGVIALSIVCLVFTQGRKEKGIVKRMLYGTVSLYGLMGYLSDVLSYARLLALGMATGVIALIINTLAGLVLEIPVIGIVICAVILAVGHPFNMVLNLLGSYIHSSRLQYIEFFSKFFEGGGKKFKPFKVTPEYVSV